MNTKIFVMTHKKIEAISDQMYIPLQVGSEGKEDYGYIRDNTGDNISAKNLNYCELTGIYWLWKNMECEVIGVCHYRRFFIREERLLSREEIEKQIEKTPIIVPNSRYVGCKDAYLQYTEKHNEKDMQICREVINEKYPEYIDAFNYVMHTMLMSIGNMWITQKAIFDRYCSWLFDILFEVEKRIDLTGYNDYQRRVMGFLSERLFRVWLIMQPEMISEIEMKQIEAQEFENAKKQVKLVQRYVKLEMQPVINLFQSNADTSSLIPPKKCVDDFDGKTPVWICWWQGEEQMPELIKMCFESIKKHLPEDVTTIRFITWKNCTQYVTFSEKIIRKFKEGMISYTHLSDILRAELLYRYGGMWIDLTYLVTKPIPAELFTRQKLCTIRFKKPIWKDDVTQGRWSGNFWIAPKHHKLFEFMTIAFIYYWETQETQVDYYLIDYLISLALEIDRETERELADCGYWDSAVYDLQKKINSLVSPERIRYYEQASGIYKLNRRKEYRKYNIVGRQTIYGYLSEKYLDNMC
ncbi:DUF4422 domain-containing protein [Roseburia faecis]|uniref:DUF4422 domain-containing protein n=1 Tax=Roseburia faecis TaxID=301302 RepID=UPI003F95BBB9